MSDGTVMYFCDLCGERVDVEDVPAGWNPDTAPQACATCRPVLALPLTAAQRAQVVAWVWDNLAPRAPVAAGDALPERLPVTFKEAGGQLLAWTMREGRHFYGGARDPAEALALLRDVLQRAYPEEAWPWARFDTTHPETKDERNG